jgi:hypothetical protein
MKKKKKTYVYWNVESIMTKNKFQTKRVRRRQLCISHRKRYARRLQRPAVALPCDQFALSFWLMNTITSYHRHHYYNTMAITTAVTAQWTFTFRRSRDNILLCYRCTRVLHAFIYLFHIFLFITFFLIIFFFIFHLRTRTRPQRLCDNPRRNNNAITLSSFRYDLSTRTYT